MVKTMSARDARANFSDLLGSVYFTKEPVIVEKKGKPVAVVISTEEYARLQQQAIERGWATVAAIQERNADEDPDDILALVTTIVDQVRQERHERR